jgi:hypothetical protein
VAARVLNMVLMFLLGALIGSAGTVAQQSTVTIAGWPAPWGLAVALIAVGCLLAGVRLVTDGRLMTLVAAVGIVAPILLFSLPSAGGSVLIPGNPYAMVWAVGPILIAAAAVLWPASRPRPAA